MDELKTPPARWIVGERDPIAEARLVKELRLPSVVAAILAQRGVTDPAEAERFIHPRLEDLHDPKLLPDFKAAATAILGARERKERIYIHGDYDVDGITSAAILSRFLTAVGCDVVTHVPHRIKEGYGIHSMAVQEAAESGARLFLTCDCGTSALEQVEAAQAAGMTVVVTDHHSLGPILPSAEAFVNPHRNDSKYPFAELSGAGVVFKLCQGLAAELGFGVDKYHRAFLDLAALGTIVDVMPLVGENRIIAKFGLERIGDTPKVGLQALKATAKVTEPVTARHVSFVLGPRLNAAGRIDDAALALRLLMTKDRAEADTIAVQIEKVNTDRRAEQDRVLEEAVHRVEESGPQLSNVIVVAGFGWHPGIVGIVAGHLVERYNRPAFVLSIDEDGIAKGSARSIPGFNLAEAIRAHPGLFSTGGGHAMAAGCSFPAERLAEVAANLHDHAGSLLSEEDFAPYVACDLVVEPGEADFESVEAMSMLEPFGFGNSTPVLWTNDVTLAEMAPTRNPEHVRLKFTAEGLANPVWAIGFGLGRRLSEVSVGQRFDLAFKADIDEWNGRRNLKWQLKDFRPSMGSNPQRSAGV